MNNKKVKVSLGIVCVLLISYSIFQVAQMPTFILPPVYFLLILILASIAGCFVLALIFRFINKKIPFLTTAFLLISIMCLFFLYRTYSPVLTVIVPKGYVGQVTLVLSNIEKNILTVDSNGIGYVNSSTFEKVYKAPIVLNTDGNNISYQCVGFNPSTFWAKGATSAATINGVKSREIKYLAFEVVPKSKLGQKQYYDVNLLDLVDTLKLP